MRKLLLIRVAITIVVGLMVALGTYHILRPRPDPPGEARYMHCDTCHIEMVYSAKLAGGRCPKCQPPTFGTLIATRNSVAGSASNPWRNLNVAFMCEAVILLGAIVFILYHPPRAADMGYGYTQCKNCGRRLRFPAHRAGNGAGWCPLCKAMFKYPVEIGEPFEHGE